MFIDEVDDNFIQLAQMAADIMPLDQQDCIEQAAEAAHRNNHLRAEWWRGLGGYGGLDGWQFSGWKTQEAKTNG